MKKLVYSAIALAVSVLSLTSCEDVPAPYTLPTASENTEIKVAPKGSGTAEDPFNVVALDSLMDNEFDANATYYVKGIVSQVGTFNESYGNITYYIKDEEASTTFYVYRGLGLGGEKFTSESDIAIGDSVVVAGNVTIYNGTKEFVTNKSHIVYLNGKTASNSGTSTEASGTGTETDPYNVAAVLKLYENNSYDANKEVYVKGIVAKVGSIDTGSYGNATYYISDDGTSTNDFEIYRGYYLNGDKFTSADQLKVGQTVVVCGKLTEYNSTKEMAQGSKLISIEGEGTTSGSDETTTGENITISGTTVNLINNAVTAGTTSTTIDLSTLGLTNAAEVTTVTMPDESTITFDKGTNSNAPKYYTATKGIRVYANNTITFTGKATIAKVVFTCDSYNGTDYVGNTTATVTFSGNTAVYTNASENAGVQLRVKTITIYYAN
ncbi:hypothetical protein SAMN05216455_101490 [Segatella bryantii]|uniref:hypothetical protein n=1 Tax=Segatella bryantii TaxID=77095 RepID=UPI00089983FC|nr:hypothetical protein [Segatella bryantii]SDZ83751.1 hypothetical protein SAMN05216455_101490 [Segatella bryantii]